MLKTNKNAPAIDVANMRSGIVANNLTEPTFKKKMLGYDEKEVQEYIKSISNVLENTKISFQSDNEQIRTEVSILSREKEGYIKQFENFNTEINSYKEQLDASNSKLKNLEEYIEKMKDSLKEYDKLMEAKSNMDKLETKLVESEEQLSLEKNKNMYLVSQNETLKNSLTDNIKENTKLKENTSKLNLYIKKEQAAVEGSLFSYKQNQKEKIELAKQHIIELQSVIDSFFNNYSQTEQFILNKFKDNPED